MMAKGERCGQTGLEWQKARKYARAISRRALEVVCRRSHRPEAHLMRASVWMTTRRMPVSGEGVGDQAGPEQEDSCRCQCKKAVRDEVLIAHLTVSVLVRLKSLRSEKNLKTWLA